MEGLPAAAVAGRGGHRAAVLTGRRQIVLWRHGRTAWNLQGRYQGGADVPLDEVGLAQAEQAARLLTGLTPAAIVSSDLSRAAATADALAALTGLPVARDERLRERCGGEWEGLTGPEIHARWPEHRTMAVPPGGESLAEVGKRVAAGVEEALTHVPADGVLVVASHGAAIRAGISTMLGLPEDVWERLGTLSNCAWSILGEVPADWVLSGWRLLEHNAGTLPQPVLSDDR